MAFEQVVDAAVDLLRRRRRVTRGLLQREFGLDDAAFADLRDELLHGQRVAREEDGQVLVWRDAHTVAPAERRQLTVMFCDLVGSTRLAAALDPEDLREVVHRYQAECSAVLEPLGGHIAQYLGDGILAYFGYPQTHEDDAERAVRAGLGLVQAVRRLNERLRARFRVELQVRVGIHTGLVVIGDMGSAERRETLALGEAPNLAAHIQARAEPNTVLASEDTFRLLAGRFVGDLHSEQPLKEGSRALRLLRIASENDPLLREQRTGRLLIDLHGHGQQLRSAWEQACSGRAGAVLVRGEAGLGKTRLVDELRTSVRSGSAEVLVLRCSAFHRHSALHPFAEQIARRAGLEADSPSDDVSERLRALLQQAGLDDVQALGLLALLAAPGSATAAAAATLPPAQLMQATQALLIDWLAAAAQRAPLLLVCEDLHWADPSTLALLQRLVDTPCAAQSLLVLTARPDFVPPWGSESPVATLTLDRMPANALAELVRQVAGPRQLAPALVERIVAVAEGVPLYAEEIAKAVLDSAAAAQAGAPIEVPATLQASLLARLDRLGAIKPVAQTAALLGREFSFELLAAVADLPVAQLGPALHELVSADLLRRRGTPPQARYTFRHALLQAAAADSLLRSSRTQLHRRIADALQTRFGAVADAEPETLARHLSEAGESMRAIPLWQRAGERALARSALVEATAHLDAGLALLHAAGTGTERDRIELELQVQRASALRATKGVAAPDTGEAYERAVALARRLEDSARLVPALNGLYAYHMVRGQCDAALAPAQALLQVAQARGDAVMQMIGHRAVGAVAFHLGEPLTAREHLEVALAAYDPMVHAPLAVTLGIDHKVTASNFLSLTLFVLGDEHKALQVQRAGLAQADALDHAHSKAQARVFGCLLLALRGDWKELPLWAERVIDLGRTRGFPLMEGGATFFFGAAQAFGGGGMAALEAGLQTMQQGAQLWWGTGARNYRSYGELLMAQAQAALGRFDAARQLLAAARQGIEDTGERWVEPELLRMEGLLLREVDGQDASIARLQQALALAHAQGAAGWERRAAISLMQTQAAMPSQCAGAATTTP
ncbi:AAA family ATPase [Ideonella sp. BN130291]|uniref:AAA family ATPase n=1 Tax=Ideonella sp. BN130291 TaxID=3112940 RepID=UPI002E26FC70|nr:AAA family ATPase [Ideonella sp. BN130291]